MNLDDPVATALFVAEALDRAGQRHALFGGLLLAAYGDPRETRDALTIDDFVVFKTLATRERDLDDAASVLRRSGDVLDMILVEQEIEKLAVEIPDWDVRARWDAVRTRAR